MNRDRPSAPARRAVAAIVVALLPVGACGTDTEQGAATDRSVEQPIEWHACDDATLAEGDCATVTVPVDHDDPTGRTIDVALFRLESRARRIGVMLVNPGGPGASGIEYVRDRGRDGFPGGFDVVGFDPRGFGRSDIDVGDRLGSRDVARDMDRIRAALGEDRITYVGFSYGGLLGWTYASMFPGHVRAMVLDAVEDPGSDEHDRQVAQANTLAGLLDRFTTACTANPTWACPADPSTSIAQILDTADASPLPTGEDSPPLTAGYAVNAVLSAFYDEATWPALGPAILRALDGDGRPLAELSYVWRQDTGTDEYIDASAAQERAFCADHAERPTVDETRAMIDEFGRIVPAVAGHLPDPEPRCAGLPDAVEPAPPPPERVPFPVVVIGSTGDPATPYAGVVHLAELLGDNARLVTRVGDGHTSYGIDRCVDLVVDRFLTSGELPVDDVRCDSSGA